MICSSENRFAFIVRSLYGKPVPFAVLNNRFTSPKRKYSLQLKRAKAVFRLVTHQDHPKPLY